MNSEQVEQSRSSHSRASHSKSNNNSTSMAGRSSGAVSIGTKPTLIEVKPMRFLIMDAPRQGNLHVYMKEMRKHHVHHVVRVCEPTYQAGELENAGISLHEMGYQDGSSPAKELIDKWLQLVEKTFYQKQLNPATAAATESSASVSAGECIAVHCVAGLGRAPVMVAVALIEFANMDPVEAVSFIRERRRGAINEKQLIYLEGYKKQYRRSGGGAETGCCVIL
jgi:protein tyrosine phosphatase type 4A